MLARQFRNFELIKNVFKTHPKLNLGIWNIRTTLGRHLPQERAKTRQLDGSPSRPTTLRACVAQRRGRRNLTKERTRGDEETLSLSRERGRWDRYVTTCTLFISTREYCLNREHTIKKQWRQRIHDKQA